MGQFFSSETEIKAEQESLKTHSTQRLPIQYELWKHSKLTHAIVQRAIHVLRIQWRMIWRTLSITPWPVARLGGPTGIYRRKKEGLWHECCGSDTVPRSDYEKPLQRPRRPITGYWSVGKAGFLNKVGMVAVPPILRTFSKSWLADEHNTRSDVSRLR